MVKLEQDAVEQVNLTIRSYFGLNPMFLVSEKNGFVERVSPHLLLAS